MFRLFHAGRCDTPIELAGFISRKPILFPSGLTETRTSPSHSSAVRRLYGPLNLSVLLQRDEYASLGINGPVGSIGQRVRH